MTAMPQCALTISGFRLGTRRADMRSRITKVGAVAVLAASALAITVGTARAAGQAPVTKPVQLTGSQLAADLLPAGTFPSGYRYDKSTSSDSGQRLETGQAKYHLASISCTTLSNVYGGSGFGETRGRHQLLQHPRGQPHRYQRGRVRADGLPVRERGAVVLAGGTAARS
jgi:hypothetical protein